MKEAMEEHYQRIVIKNQLMKTYDEGEFGIIDPIRTISLTKNLEEAIIYQKPYEFNPQFVFLKKINGK
jgi:hypothetical protein